MRIWNGFEEFFCLLSGLKTGVENNMFWSEIGSAFGEPGAAHPTKNSQGYLPGINVKTIKPFSCQFFYSQYARSIFLSFCLLATNKI